LLYLVPPLTVVMAQAASFLARCGRVPKRLVGGAAALLFAMQYLVGVQIEYTHGFHPRPVPTLTTLVHWPVKTPAVAGVSLVVGAGATITTHDSIRLSSGLWFANLTWRHYKQQAQDVSQALTGFLNQVDRREIGVFVGSFTEARLLACRALYRDGYVLAENLGRANTSVWRKGDRTVRVLQGDIGLSQARSILATETIVVLEVWDQELRRKMQRCAPSAERLAGNERSAHAAYVVRDPAREGPPPGEKTHGTRNGDESMKASRRDFLKAPGASGPSAGPTTGDRGVRRGGLSPTALP
jgi:hypothetical protein